MLEWNRQRVQNLTGTEIWLFIVARVLLSFGLGALAMAYLPSATSYIAWPTLIIGTVLFVLASKGLFRAPTSRH